MQRDLLAAKRSNWGSGSNRSQTPVRPPLGPSAKGRSNSASSSPSPCGPPSPGGEAVNVAVRVRPPFTSESGQEVIVSMDPSLKAVYVKNRMDERQAFHVDMPVWSCVGTAIDGSAPVSQAALYEAVGRPLLHHALEGFNSTLMAYGQTGSGKTYTMMGDASRNLMTDNDDVLNKTEEGIIPRLCRDMFQQIQNRSFSGESGETVSWEVHVSFVEVYCEKISDLLNHSAPVTLRDEIVDDETYFSLVGARHIPVTCTQDILKALNIGNKCRKTASTSMNERSSRSHAIFVVELAEIVSFTNPEGEVASAPSKSLAIRLVDLAGSERVGETGVSGQQFKEGVDINLSLFTLGLVIESLADPKRRNAKPPYRESTLTKILKDAFGGNSKTTMICTISPTEAYRQQTIQTLMYGSKARRVVNKPHVEENPSAAVLRRATEELLVLRQQLNEARRGSRQYQDIVQRLTQADERLRQEQEISRRRKAVLEKKEAELAERYRKMEEERQAYDNRVQELGAEVERAKVKQKERERELHKERRRAEAVAEGRLRELESQHETAMSQFKCKEEELMRKKQDTEERMKQVERDMSQRIEGLLRAGSDLEEELREKKRASKKLEDELTELRRHSEKETRKLQEQIIQNDKEWGSKYKTLQEELQQQEKEANARLGEALQARKELDLLQRDKAAEAETRQKEATMAIRSREIVIEQLEKEMKQMSKQLEDQTSTQSLYAKQVESDFTRKISEMEETATRERRAAQRLQDELQRALDRLSSKEPQHDGTEGDLNEGEEKQGRALSEKALVEWEALLKQREANIAERERELEQQWQDHMRACDESQRAVADAVVEVRTRSEAAAALEADLKARFATIDGDAENLAACLQLGENALKRREVWDIESLEEQRRELLRGSEENDVRLIRRQMQLDKQEIFLKDREKKLKGALQNARTMAKSSQWMQSMIVKMEDRCRKLLVATRRRECDLMKQLEVATRKLCSVDAHSKVVEIVLSGEAAVARQAELQLREEGLVEEERRLTHRIAEFEALQRKREEDFRRKDEKVKLYLLELEVMDREKMETYRRLEEELAAARAELLHRKRTLADYVGHARQMLLQRSEEQQADFVAGQEVAERESIERTFHLQDELELCRGAVEGNVNSAQELLRLKENEIKAEAKRLQHCIERLRDDETRRQKRIAAEEKQTHAYLLELEEEDARRTRLAKEEGGQLLREAEAYRDEVQKREAALEEYSRQLQSEAAERENKLQQLEERLFQQQEEAERRLQERTADIDRRRHEASTVAEDNERTLKEQEADLTALLEKNKAVEKQIKERDAELQRQRYHYIDLRKLLEEREKLLLREHAHRMNGKESATQLTDDLLDVNELLKHELKMWMQKYDVLKTDEKLECERCSWRNKRDATVCRCCGNSQLV
ncbi:putative Unc104-like kinesin [Trypanosoma grayi]|uniref:putative Unc104-like kinesin n=1 Tax=Trypanosoma grayi TaxID=71804 RepID=UPI0004F3F3B5|nr:putative Unc104-like kinesin [Trypanosoma grayi]KEG14414.1 putative Unc104-like kinesin [Trypanosoma grayi]